MPLRQSLTRLLRWAGTSCVGVLAVVGGLGLHGPGLFAIGVTGLLAASTAVGFAREAIAHDRPSLTEAAVQAGAWTVGLLLALAGLATVAGGFVALLTAVVVAVTWLAVRAARSRPPASTGVRSPSDPWAAPGAEALLFPVPPPEDGRSSGAAERTSAVSALPTPALGREWLRTSAALGARLSAADRQALVRRRVEMLDELERRDAEGFARWLADGPSSGSDPAAFVRGRSEQGDQAAGSEAA